MTGRGAEGQRACHGWLSANRLILVASALSPGRRDAVVSAPGEAYCRGKDTFGMPVALNTAVQRTRLSTRPGGTPISWRRTPRRGPRAPGRRWGLRRQDQTEGHFAAPCSRVRRGTATPRVRRGTASPRSTSLPITWFAQK